MPEAEAPQELPVAVPAQEGVVSPQPQAEGEQNAQNTGDQAPPTQSEGDDPDKPTPEQAAKREGRRVERKISNLYRKAAEERARAEAAERELEQLRKAQTVHQDDPQAPKLEQFSDLTEFQRAVEKYGYEKGQKELQQRAAQEARQREQQAIVSAWEAKADKASSKYEDFDEKVGELKPTTPWAFAIMEADNGDDIAYYLGTHLDEARSIAQMSPAAQIRAIGRLEAKLAAEPAKPKTPSKAPAPITPIQGKSGGTNELPSDSDDIDTWMRKERARLEKKRQYG